MKVDLARDNMPVAHGLVVETVKEVYTRMSLEDRVVVDLRLGHDVGP